MQFIKMRPFPIVYSLLFCFISSSLWSNPDPQAPFSTPKSMCIGTAGTVDWLIWYDDVPGYTHEETYHLHNYPQSPDDVKTLTSIATIPNYTNHYGSMVRGYIQAPETGKYVFNVTGDDNVEFMFSTDDLPANLDTIANVPGWSGQTEHDKYPEQTSDTLNLVAGEYHYFEARHHEGGGGDHIIVHWKRPSIINNTSWEVIHGAYLYATACAPICPVAGTPCDDGDASTTNDIEDGFCNCNGFPTSAPACVGEVRNLEVLYFDGVAGNDITDLQADANYPLSPSRIEFLEQMRGPLAATFDDFGTRVSGFLRVPVSGNYTFNLSSNNEGAFSLSTDETVGNLTQVCFVDNNMGIYSHDVEPSQTSSPIALTAGNFYYFELEHKDGCCDDHFHLFWKTPFTNDDLWRFVDGVYLFQNTCDMACSPQGTPCDDGDATTFNDQYDASCSCIGTPCADPDCTNALDYVPFDDCAYTEEHSTHEDDSWLSCVPSQGPNPARAPGHWVHYDFGAPYILENSQIWNYNVTGGTAQGFEEVVVDYSLDGINWTELGTYTWSQAPGTNNYGGFNFPDVNGLAARHVLITALGNFDDSACMGISEITFSANECPEVGTPCDDGDPATSGDSYDSQCNCAGAAIIVNECTVVSRTINDNPVVTNNYSAIETIFSAGVVPVGAIVSYIAGESITLNPGFEVVLGADFLADIIPCSPPSTNFTLQDGTVGNIEAATATWLTIEENEDNSSIHIDYHLPYESNAQLTIYTPSGKVIQQLSNGYLSAGQYQKILPLQKVSNGLYLIVLQTENERLSKRLVIVD